MEAVSIFANFLSLRLQHFVWIGLISTLLSSYCAQAATITHVAAGGQHALALDDQGRIWDSSTGVFSLLPGNGYSQISAGLWFSYALKTDGSLWAWGEHGPHPTQFGSTSSTTPTQIDTGYKQISTGRSFSSHVMAIRSDSTLWGWGANNYGQLGTNTVSQSRQLAALIGEGYSQVSAGQEYTLAIKADGTLWAWGRNQYGQLGNGSTANTSTPVKIGDGFSLASAGEYQSFAIKIDGSLWAWGAASGSGSTIYPQPVQVGTGFSKVTAGFQSSLAIKTDGSLWELQGIGFQRTATGQTLSQMTMIGTGYTSIGSSGINYTQYAIRNTGTLETWGSPMNLSEGGSGLTHTALSPVKIGYGYTQVMAAYDSSFAIKFDGALWAWGSNGLGQLGSASLAQNEPVPPTQVSTEFTSVSSGSNHSLGLRHDGSLWSWGQNTFGQLGNGTTSSSASMAQIGTGFTKISAGRFYSSAIKADGSLWTWGNNSNGQLGRGDRITSATPIQIGVGFKDVAAGEQHTLAVKNDGTLWAWGDNSMGQLGNGTRSTSLAPIQVGNGFSQVAVGTYHSLALKGDGSLWAWGYGFAGQLGKANLPNDNTETQPVQILQNIKFIAANGERSFAITAGGQLLAWGDNRYGYLGNGTPHTNQRTPTPIGPTDTLDNPFVTLSTGNGHTLALQSDGTLWGWGRGAAGQLALPYLSQTYQSSPLEIRLGSSLLGGISSAPAVGGLRLTAQLQPSPEHLRMSGHKFLVAVLPNGLPFIYGSNGWVGFDRNAPLPWGVANQVDGVTLFSALNTAGLVGTALYMGYGLGATALESFEEMRSNGRFKRAYVIN